MASSRPARGTSVFGMFYGDDDDDLPRGSWLRHHYQDIMMGRLGGRMLTLVADSEAPVARIPTKGDPTALRTGSSLLTLIVQEYLHHDLVLMRAQINIGFDELGPLVAGGSRSSHGDPRPRARA